MARRRDKKKNKIYILITFMILICLIVLFIIGKSWLVFQGKNMKNVSNDLQQMGQVESETNFVEIENDTQEFENVSETSGEYIPMQSNSEESERLKLENTDTEENNITEKIESMSIEEKVAQLFVITPEALTNVGQVTMAGEVTREAFVQYPVGGLVYFTNNFLSEEQMTDMLCNTQRYSYEVLELPVFTCVDEEGGDVTRISGKGIVDVPYIGGMKEIGAGGSEKVYDVGKEIGEYLRLFGFSVDFAPVADVVTNSANTVIGNRSFGSEPQTVAELVTAFVEGMHTQNVATTLKHFPGHGNTNEDSHYSCAVSYKSLDELRSCEFVPFRAGIEAGTEFIMIGHISLPNVIGDQTPATLSYTIVSEILRKELKYKGIIITDAMNMAAITDCYSSDVAAVKAVKAGVDMILMPYDFNCAYKGVLNAVYSGEISEDRIDESVMRILKLKYSML